jgi:hypothetical protein
MKTTLNIILLFILPVLSISQVSKSVPSTLTHKDSTITSVNYKIGGWCNLFNEPSFLEYSKDSSLYAYRFIWIRSFHVPISFRLTINPYGSGLLIVKKGNKIASQWDGLALDSCIALNSKQVTEITNKINNTAFWNDNSVSSGIQLDGSIWILEGVKGGRYHSVEKESPPNNPFKELCFSLLNYSGMSGEKIY